MSPNKPQQPPAATVVTFRPEFYSPDYLNSLLRLQHLHWLQIQRRPAGPAEGAVSGFQFVIPASQSNLLCVLGTEMPLLEAELSCRVRQIPVPDFVTPDGLRAFGVDYAAAPTAALALGVHAKFLAALEAICVRLQLTRICLDPNASGGASGAACAACSRVRTHTKSVRGSSAVRPRPRKPAPMLDLARQRVRRPASVEVAAPSGEPAVAAKKSSSISSALKAAAAVERMVESAVSLLQDRMRVLEAAADVVALADTAASRVLRICSGSSGSRRMRQFGLDFSISLLVADAVAVRDRLCADVAGVFADWSGELAGRLITGCSRMVAANVALAGSAASGMADAIAADQLGCLVSDVAAEMVSEGHPVVRVSLPCDWQTRRVLLALRPVHRRCPACGAAIIAEAAGPTGYRLTIRSRGRRCSQHASMLQLADCARSTKDSALGGLLLQDVAALPANWA